MLPNFLKPFLWSYNIEAMDLQKDKKRIITNVLNYGTLQATNWLFSVYSRKDVSDVLLSPLPGEWNNKSLNYWCLLFEVPLPKTIRQLV